MPNSSDSPSLVSITAPIETDPPIPDRFERTEPSEIETLRQFLNQALAAYDAELAELEFRDERLQISISGREVPLQEAVEGLIKERIVQLRLVKVQKVELYGQKEGYELPFWRSEFNPAELELATPRQKPPEIKPVAFAFQKTDIPKTDATASTQTGATSSAEISESAEERDTTDKKVVEDAATTLKRKAVEDFLARYAAGERVFTKIDLSEADLSGVNLTLADLQEAQLVWANLQGASLYHVNLLGAKLRQANLKGVKLRSANLRGADFLNADLSEADLSWSNLTGANLTGANLTDANLKNAILDNVIMPDGTRLD
jgi:uncharacterized protein YjbI with pentapeptide repeats